MILRRRRRVILLLIITRLVVVVVLLGQRRRAFFLHRYLISLSIQSLIPLSRSFRLPAQRLRPPTHRLGYTRKTYAYLYNPSNKTQFSSTTTTTTIKTTRTTTSRATPPSASTHSSRRLPPPPRTCLWSTTLFRWSHGIPTAVA